MTPEREALAEIARQAPGQPVAYGIDHRGPWARIGETSARGKPGAVEALNAALEKYGLSVAESGGTASPKSDNHSHSEGAR